MERSEYRRYDPRLKNLVADSEDIRKFLKYGIVEKVSDTLFSPLKSLWCALLKVLCDMG